MSIGLVTYLWLADGALVFLRTGKSSTESVLSNNHRSSAGDSQIVISYAFADSDNIDFGARGIIDTGLGNGIVYARYKKLHIVVKIADGKKKYDLIRARRKFDEYHVPVKNR